VLEGGRHILAEVIAESADVRSAVRNVLWDTGRLCTSKSDKLAEGQGLEYKDYFQFSEPVRHIPPHRILAINRGEKENALVVKIEWDAAIGQRVAEERLPLPMPEVVAVAPSSVVEAPAAENAAAAPPPEPLHVPVTPPRPPPAATQTPPRPTGAPDRGAAGGAPAGGGPPRAAGAARRGAAHPPARRVPQGRHRRRAGAPAGAEPGARNPPRADAAL